MTKETTMRIIVFLGALLWGASAWAQPAPSGLDGGYWAGGACNAITFTGPNGPRTVMVDANGNLCVSGTSTVSGTVAAGPAAIVGYGVLALTAASTAMSTLTLSPNSGAWTATGTVFIKNRSASAGNAYVCPMGGACTSAVGIELVPGQAYGFTKPASAMTVIAASTATVEAQW